MPTYQTRTPVVPLPKYDKLLHSLSGIEVDYYNLRTKRFCWPLGINALGRHMLFTGPDGYGDHRVKTVDDPTYVGIGSMSTEGTSSTTYLYRPDWKNPPQLFRKHERVGGIGWGVPKYNDPAPPLTGYQIRRGEVRLRAEDMHTHLYMAPWYPPPTRPRVVRPNTVPSMMRQSSSSSHSLDASTNLYPIPPAVSARPHTRGRERSYYGANYRSYF